MLGTSSSTNFTVLKTLGIDIPSPSKTSTEKHLKPSTFPIVSSKSRLVNFQSTTFHLNRFRFLGEKGRPPPFSSEKKHLKLSMYGIFTHGPYLGLLSRPFPGQSASLWLGNFVVMATGDPKLTMAIAMAATQELFVVGIKGLVCIQIYIYIYKCPLGTGSQ